MASHIHNRNWRAVAPPHTTAAFLPFWTYKLARPNHRRSERACRQPVVKGTGISVEIVIGLLAAGWTPEQILDNFPNLPADDIRACLAYAGELVKEERVYSVPT